jgi:Rieske Fe-S protein
LPKKSPKEVARDRARRIEERETVKRGRSQEALGRFQFAIGILLVFSAIFGIYLLATDQSLWILAASHAYGLVAIIGIDLVLGALSLLFVRRVYLLSVSAAFLGVLLQVGDVVTASQYGMTIAYFASYLFGLWAFDALVVSQLMVLFLGLFSRVHLRTLSTATSRFRPEFSASRRQFLKSMIAFGGVVALAAVFSLIQESRPSLPTTSQANLPAGAVANTGQVSAGSPIYFDYPTGYPNVLLQKSDGSLIALSMLCTHVCCQLSYDPTNNQLYCPCHGSLFDENGNVVQGPAVVPLPTVVFTTDANNNVFPQRANGTSPCNQS